ncbi:hypothetical protein HPP92_022916 [Vanilla planifolia]|uniref:Uncharacterized protein n=1 Tax=Vanilla planifolia TaxID=51239 RepID=A0A835UCN3_VANPL|nr:hypothetical protein HPP92_023236 [Vanilla planifolia]KAG0458122.1 hypothetical protein HPP92_023279 [Vanilla planifolia]KAG0459788.1 hypothetical protein HPP92_022916 [Vanilla planifolia]
MVRQAFEGSEFGRRRKGFFSRRGPASLRLPAVREMARGTRGLDLSYRLKTKKSKKQKIKKESMNEPSIDPERAAGSR